MPDLLEIEIEKYTKEEAPKSLKSLVSLAKALAEAPTSSARTAEARKLIYFDMADRIERDEKDQELNEQLNKLYADETLLTSVNREKTIAVINNYRYGITLLNTFKFQIIKSASQLSAKQQQKNILELVDIMNQAESFIKIMNKLDPKLASKLNERIVSAESVIVKSTIETAKILYYSEPSDESDIKSIRETIAEIITLFSKGIIKNIDPIITLISADEAYTICLKFIKEPAAQADALTALAKHYIEIKGIKLIYKEFKKPNTNPIVKIALSRALLQSNIGKNKNKSVLNALKFLVAVLDPEEAQKIIASNPSFSDEVRLAINQYIKDEYAQTVSDVMVIQTKMLNHYATDDKRNLPKVNLFCKSAEDLANAVLHAQNILHTTEPDSKQGYDVLFFEPRKMAIQGIFDQVPKLAKLLQTCSDYLADSKFIKMTPQKRIAAQQMTFLSEARGAMTAARRQYISEEVTLKHKKNLTKSLQSLSTAIYAVNPNLLDKLIIKIIENSSPLTTYAIFENHPDEDVKIALADKLLAVGLETFNPKQIETLIGTLAAQYPEKVYSYFHKLPQHKDDLKRTMASAILRNAAMRTWLPEQILDVAGEKFPTKFYFTLIAAEQYFEGEAKSSQHDLKSSEQAQQVFDGWSRQDYQNAIECVALIEAEKKTTTKCHQWIHWGMLSQKDFVQGHGPIRGLPDKDIINSLNAIDVMNLSVSKIQLLTKKARLVYLRNVINKSWKDVRNISIDKVNALIHDFEENDIANVITSKESQSALIILFGKFPRKIVDRIKSDELPAHARLIINELSTGIWKKPSVMAESKRPGGRSLQDAAKLQEEMESKRSWFKFWNEDNFKTNIDLLITAGFYKLEASYDIENDPDNLAANQLIKLDLEKNFDRFLQEANGYAFKFILTTPALFLCIPANKRSIFIAAAAKKIDGPEEYSQIIASLRRYDHHIHADTLLKNLPSFIETNRHFKNDDIDTIIALINEAKEHKFDFATQGFKEKDKLLSSAEHPLLKAINENLKANIHNEPAKKGIFKLAGRIYASSDNDFELLQHFLSSAKNYTPPGLFSKAGLIGGAVVGIATATYLIVNHMWDKFNPISIKNWWPESPQDKLIKAISAAILPAAIALSLGPVGTTALIIAGSVVVGYLVGSLLNGAWEGLKEVGSRLSQWWNRKLPESVEQHSILVNVLKSLSTPERLKEFRTTLYNNNNADMRLNLGKMVSKLRHDGLKLEGQGISSKTLAIIKPICADYDYNNRNIAVKIIANIAGFFVGWSVAWNKLGLNGLWGFSKDYHTETQLSSTAQSKDAKIINAPSIPALLAAARPPIELPPPSYTQAIQNNPSSQTGQELQEAIAAKTEALKHAAHTEKAPGSPLSTFDSASKINPDANVGTQKTRPSAPISTPKRR